MRRRDAAPGPGELEALDPLTGESLTLADDDRVADAGPATSAADRARRRRNLARALAAASMACAGAAAYFGLTVLQLRGVERTWREAMAVDAARRDADRQVLAVLEDVGSVEDGEARARALDPLGTEAAAALRRHERALAGRRILDAKVSDLRDAMVEALEFRRFQMSPQRDRLGDTPLRAVEADVAAQLERWDLSPTRPTEPAVAALDPMLRTLRRYADVRTGTTLFALSGTRLTTVDVDASSHRDRRLRREPSALLSTKGGVAVVDEDGIVVHGPDPDAAPLAVIDGTGGATAVAAGDDSGDLWVTSPAAGTVRRFRVASSPPGWAADPVPLPAGRTVVGSTFHELVLADFAKERIELWSPTTLEPPVELAPRGARFLAARGDIVLWQGPLPFSPRPTSTFLHRYAVGAKEHDLIGLPRADATSAVLDEEGTAVVFADGRADRLGSALVLQRDSTALVGVPGPRAKAGGGVAAFSSGGRALFWLTPDGDIAMVGPTPDSVQVLRTGLRGVDVLAVMGR